ncbi:TIGR04283 family arsenosugar biosynthesis glycosyltransferase [Pseudohongiella sp.]|uniref:Glycosyltransferase 2-like domain-containing protein n=1 Tax=marine sediment metagenome TaxID=412755 RepID=A0A0F9Z383_9ZZZZ|nr:TIGR04283 family arsenosugar biosynthesis glycosyltransferase [Pseudohongiella sp.]HDZ09163.1 DUF2064 domain-containing protein [Pseudohongiella sp.]
MSTLSIIIPVLNEAQTLRRQLAALQALRRQGHQLVLVDGGSTDASVQEAQGLVDVCVSSAPGRARQMNAGAAHAVGDILLFLHIDTLLPAQAADLVTAALADGAKCWGRFDVRLDGAHPAFAVIGRAMNLRSRLTAVATGDQAIFVRRAVFEQVGGYADVPLMEDVMISKTLRRLSRPACLSMPVISSSRRWQKHGIMTTVWLMWRLRLAFFLGASPASLHAQYYRGSAMATSYRYPQARILFFAKTPVAGQVKTRLQPVLGESGALDLHQRLIRFGWQQLWRSAQAPMQLWASADGGQAFFAKLDGAPQVYQQMGCDLGARMQHATQAALADAEFVVVVGADCPSVDGAYVAQALALLAAGERVVLGPAEDGGYVLIGLRAPAAAVFRDINWGQPQVMAQTRERLRQADIAWRELPPRWDVDRPEDLYRLDALPGWRR